MLLHRVVCCFLYTVLIHCHSGAASLWQNVMSAGLLSAIQIFYQGRPMMRCRPASSACLVTHEVVCHHAWHAWAVACVWAAVKTSHGGIDSA